MSHEERYDYQYGSRYTVNCKQCGEVCGTFYDAKISGPPEDCSPAEYGTEPEVIDDEGNEFCSQECCDEYHADEEENEEEEAND